MNLGQLLFSGLMSTLLFLFCGQFVVDVRLKGKEIVGVIGLVYYSKAKRRDDVEEEVVPKKEAED